MPHNINNSEAVSYRRLRRMLGYLGLILTLLLLGYTVIESLWLDGKGLRPSISDFYYSHVGDIFVGILCTIGLFLLMYRGHDHTAIEVASPRLIDKLTDKQIAVAGGIGAIGTALFPLRGPACGQICTEFTGFALESSVFHFLFAGLFFVSTAAFCLIMFTRGNGTQDNKVPYKGGTIVKIAWTARNRFFVTCGGIIIACILALLAYKVFDWLGFTEIVSTLDNASYFFWVEVTAVLAFSQAWLEKGNSPISALARIAPKSKVE